MMFPFRFLLLVIIPCLIHWDATNYGAEAFSLLSRRAPSSTSMTRSSATTSTRLWYRNETLTIMPSPPSTTATDNPTVVVVDHDPIQEYRTRVKQALAVAAIEDYDMDAYNAGMTTIAEEYMKELELVRPWAKPALHSDLNARWSFVFTGVPTIGMKLITLLSRLSVGVSGLDFDNVFLEVSHQQSQVKAIVRIQLFGRPAELNVYTQLAPQPNDPHGTLLIESFRKLCFMGVEIPTPQKWKSSRQLEISYLDQDMMIARTNGGEPHLLLRHSPCSTDDATCDLDTTEPTPYFQDALQKYGSHLSRSLVDRAYTMTNSSEQDDRQQQLDIPNIVRLIQGIVNSPNGH